MKRKQIFLLAAAMAVAGLAVWAVVKNDQLPVMNRVNPLLQPYETPYEIPPFDQIMVEDYIPALKEGIDIQRQEIKDIVSNSEKPTFANTILALDRSGELVEKTMMLFSALDEAMSSPELVDVAADVYAMYQQWGDEMSEVRSLSEFCHLQLFSIVLSKWKALLQLIIAGFLLLSTSCAV